MKRFLSTALAVLLMPCLASATTIIAEDFESYADTTELGVAWTLGDGTLDTVLGNPGQSLSQPGTSPSFSAGNTNTMSFASTYPGPGETLIFETDIYDAGVSNARMTAGLRRASGANIIEMGMYNNPIHYAIRTVLFEAGSDGSWVAFDNVVDDSGNPIANEPVIGWHRYRVEITDTQATFTLDLNSDGFINATLVATITENSGNPGFDIVRLGGPSSLSSPAGVANFDNVNLTLIPEPTSALLVVMGAIAFVARRK